MTKLRKQRRRKVYKHDVNRKRLRNKIFGVGKVACKEIKNAWEKSKSVKVNMNNMGLSYDPNKTIGIPNPKKKLIKTSMASNNDEWYEEKLEVKPSKSYVVEQLEAEAKAPRQRLFRLPKNQVEWITYLMDKYGTDYKKMAKDKKNYYQETWKQLRAKIKTFKNIPEQYKQYLKERNLEFNDVKEPLISDDEI